MNDALQKIRQRGHWRMEVRPTKYQQARVPDWFAIQDIVRRCAVRLTGWPYPDDDDMKNRQGDGPRWVECASNFEHHIELWRFYQSAQFIHFLALAEDYSPEAEEAARRSVHVWDPARVQPKGFMEVIQALYTLTQVFEFAARLAQRGILDPEVFISVKLVGAKDRMLFLWDPLRFLLGPYLCRQHSVSLHYSGPAQELTARRHELALNKSIELFQLFNWDNPNKNVLAEDQRKLLEGRF